jgi:tetratricopeptide (TPR) repeat protein
LQARLTANADDAIASQLLGQVYASRNDMNKALEYFNKAMKNTKWEVPYMSAASVYLAQKNIAGAQAVLEKGVAQASNPVQIQLQLASLYESQKNYDKAIVIYEKVIEVNPANQMAANNLASLLLDVRGDPASVRRALELATGFAKTKHPALMDTLGWATLKNNDAAKAISVLEEVIRMAPEVGVFQYHLGMAYQQAGDVANAKRYLTMAVASKQDYLGKDKAKEVLAKL